MGRIGEIAVTAIDHCLISGSLAVTAREVGPYIGSDHLPLVTDVALVR